MNEPTHLDLFSGIGGFALAAQWAGFRTVGYCEIEPYAQAVLKERFGALADGGSCESVQRHKLALQRRRSQETEQAGVGCGVSIHSDIFTLDGSRYRGVSLITGGFPCQPYSVAGKRRGAADDRAIWPQMCRVIAEARPGWVLAENVPGIINMELDSVLSDLEAIGYTTGTLVVPACAVDAKHRRDRVWIVGHADEGRLRRTGAPGECRHTAQSGQALANACQRRCARPGEGESEQPGRAETERASEAFKPCLWIPEPPVGRVAHGVPRRVDRLKGLGNAIVPQVAYQLLRVIRTMV